jgi:hypothetical protein
MSLAGHELCCPWAGLAVPCAGHVLFFLLLGLSWAGLTIVCARLGLVWPWTGLSMVLADHGLGWPWADLAMVFAGYDPG